MTRSYAYRGVDRRGIGRTGRTMEAPDQLVPRLYAAGWRKLVVRTAEEEVGWIRRDPETGQRVACYDRTVGAVAS